MPVPGSGVPGLAAPGVALGAFGTTASPVIPMYAPYGNAIFGETVYGWPPTDLVATTLTVSPVPNKVGLYDSLFVNWATPGGTWNEQILVRSSYGVPISPFINDGEVLLDETSNFSTSYVDTPLKSGRFYYYALYVFDQEAGVWLYSAGAQGLCLTDYNYPWIYTSWTPNWYLELDAVQDPPDPLTRFYGLLGFEMNWIRSEIESLFTLSSPEFISGAMLPWLGGNVGISYEPALGMTRSRVLVENAVNLYHIKGTLDGVAETASAYSGYGVYAGMGPNQEIQLDDAAFARTYQQPDGTWTTGHWNPQNNGSTLQFVNMVTQYGLTPQHATYEPLQGTDPGQDSGIDEALMQLAGVQGYLPVDGNENAALITANSQYSWTQNLVTQAIPGGRNSPALASDPTHHQFLLFGGQSGGQGDPWLNDTWQWTGTTWTHLSPATSPPALQFPAMSYDSVYNNVLLVGWNASTAKMETWIWNSTNWVKQNPTTQPNLSSSMTLCPGHLLATTGNAYLWLFGWNASINTLEGWVWTGPGSWSKANPPFNFSGQSAAYDNASGLIILTGGRLTSGANVFQVWTFSGTTWTNVSPTSGTPGTTYPALGGGAVMTNNPQVNHVQLFDRNSNLWSFTTSSHAWTKLSGPGVATASPTPTRAGMALHFVHADNTVLLYGGVSDSHYFLGDTWIWNAAGTAWAFSPAATSPQGRVEAAFVYNAGTNKFGLFGGAASNGQILNDLWTWTPGTTGPAYTGTWALASPTGLSPPARRAAAVCNTTGSYLFLFGGLGQDTSGNTICFNDIWQWNGTTQTWSQPTTTGGPPTARFGHGMVWDPTIAQLIVFGGEDVSGNYLNDMWYFDPVASVWSQPTITGPVPPTRAFATFVYTDPASGLSVLFGGQATGGVARAGTWLYQSATSSWTQVVYAPAYPAPPSPRYYSASVYIPNFGVLVLGGSDTTQVFGDAWVFNEELQQWNQFPLSPPDPLPRVWAMAAYDSTNSTVVFFGGQATLVAGSFLGDTWTFSLNANPFWVSECDSTNATTLGLPLQQWPSPAVAEYGTYIFSMYFMPDPTKASPTTRFFATRLDWYGANGALLHSDTGTAVQDVAGSWARAYVAALPPAGACYVGRTVISSVPLTGDYHLMDAGQTEIVPFGTTVTGPSPWSPPRDLQLSLFPNRQNLAINTQALAGSLGWSAVAGTIAPQTVAGGSTVPWPEFIRGGWVMTANASGSAGIQSGPVPVSRLASQTAGDLAGQGASTFVASFEVMSAAAPTTANNNWLITFTWKDSTGNVVGTNTFPASGGFAEAQGYWTLLATVPIVPPATAATLTVALSASGLVASSVHYMACPLIEPASVLLPFFDGNYTAAQPGDYMFEGTPNESFSDYYPNLGTRISRLMTVMPEYIPIGSTFSIFVGATAFASAAGAGGGAGGAPSPDTVQSTGPIHYGAINPATPAFSASTTLGNTLIAVIGTGNSSTVSSVSGLGTWAKAVSLVGIEIWYCLNCTAPGTTVTINWSATPSASSTACLLEIPTCSAVDVTANASGSAAGAQGPGTLTPTAHGDFFVVGLNTNGTPSAVNGHMAAMSDVGDINVAYQYQRADQQNAYTPAWTSTSGAWNAVGAAFKVMNPRVAYNVTSNTAFVTAEQSPQITVFESGVYKRRMLLWGNDDNGSALSPDRTRLWQTMNQASTNAGGIQIIDTATLTGIYAIQYPLASPTDPVSCCFSPDGTKVYVANAIANTVTVFNASTYALIATIPCGTTCHRVAVSPDGTKVYATNSFATGGPGTLSIINAVTNTVTSTLTLGADPWEIAFTPDCTHAYVAGGSANCAYVITVATGTLLTTITLGGGAHGVGMTPDGRHVYVSNNADGTVSVISTATNTVVVSVIPAGLGPATVRVKLDGTEAWVANNNDTTVSVISTATNTVTKTLPAGINPNGLSL